MGHTEFQQIQSAAQRGGWSETNQDSAGVKFHRHPYYVVVHRSPGTGKITKTKRLGPGGSEEIVTKAKFGQTLEWLERKAR